MVAAIALTGMWLERFILVQPSLWKGSYLPFGPLEIFVTTGVGALFVLCYSTFLDRMASLSIAGTLLEPEAHRQFR
jgi:hypothetical protein